MQYSYLLKHSRFINIQSRGIERNYDDNICQIYYITMRIMKFKKQEKEKPNLINNYEVRLLSLRVLFIHKK